MDYIKFYGIDLNKMDSNKLTEMFSRIKEEIGYYKFSNGVFPQKIHVYGGIPGLAFLNMMGSKHPKNHMVIMV